MPTLGAPALQAYSTRIFQACKAPADDAATVSDHLVTANLMGFA
jgi:LDH2 family malate/lactate/ureidoglycolate dehydrogenase